MPIGRRTRATPPSPPPWWGTNGSSPRPRRAQVAENPSGNGPVQPSPDRDEAYGGAEFLHRAENQVPGHERGGGSTAGYAPGVPATDEYFPASTKPIAEFKHEAAEEVRAPQGEYLQDTFGRPSRDHSGPRPAETVSPASVMGHVR